MDDVEAQAAVQTLKSQWLYEVAEQEVDQILPPDMDKRDITPAGLRTLMIATWLRGETYAREQALTTSGVQK